MAQLTEAGGVVNGYDAMGQPLTESRKGIVFQSGEDDVLVVRQISQQEYQPEPV